MKEGLRALGPPSRRVSLILQRICNPGKGRGYNFQFSCLRHRLRHCLNCNHAKNGCKICKAWIAEWNRKFLKVTRAHYVWKGWHDPHYPTKPPAKGGIYAVVHYNKRFYRLVVPMSVINEDKTKSNLEWKTRFYKNSALPVVKWKTLLYSKILFEPRIWTSLVTYCTGNLLKFRRAML